MEQSWDTALSRRSQNPGGRQWLVQMVFPADLSRSLLKAGYNRARLTVTEEGILLLPYRGEGQQRLAQADLPEWS
jgi:hypothetical protein